MTSEVALMNRSAVILAADSAATVKVWENGVEKERYFKGANKIFNICSTQPVGVMIYDGADFQGVPWEVIAKGYRDQRKGASQAHLSSYPADLFEFIISDASLFPQQQQLEQFSNYVVDSALRFAGLIGRHSSVSSATTPAAKAAAKRTMFSNFQAWVASDAYFDGIDDAFVHMHAHPNLAPAAQTLGTSQLYADVQDELTADEIVLLAAAAVFKRAWTTLRVTGVVFAGYGSSEYFPHLAHYRCYGVMFGKLIHENLAAQAKSISVDNVSEIVPLAQSDMIKTFMFGASPTALGRLDGLFETGLSVFVDDLKQNGHLAQTANVDAERSAVLQTLRQLSSTYLDNSHTKPLKQVIGLFSVPELAELAETLVSIESLKERVTTPSESVSGPIDVAAISKSDGFVWIKRKHYFDPALNPRFFERRRAN